MNDKVNIKIVLIGIFIAALALRIAGPYVRETVIIHHPFNYVNEDLFKSSENDEILYNFTAKAILEGKGFSINFDEVEKTSANYIKLKGEFPNITKAFVKMAKPKKDAPGYYSHMIFSPLYPTMLAGCYFLFGENTLAYFLPQAVLGALTCLIIFFIAELLFDRKTALLASIFVALYPDLIFWTYMARVETLFTFLLTLGVYFLLKGKKMDSPFILYAGGAAFGLACLTKITIIFFLPFVVLWPLMFVEDRRKGLFRSMLMLFILIGALFPWALRNYLVLNEFTMFSSETGTILMDKVPISNVSGSSFSILSQFVGYVSQNIPAFGMQCVNRGLKFLGPITPPMADYAKLYKLITWLVIFPLFFCGIFLAIKNAWQKNSLLVALITYYFLLHAATFVDDGLVYRYPIQPFLCIYAASAFYGIIRQNIFK